jgi:hypothetical protein
MPGPFAFVQAFAAQPVKLGCAITATAAPPGVTPSGPGSGPGGVAGVVLMPKLGEARRVTRAFLLDGRDLARLQLVLVSHDLELPALHRIGKGGDLPE